MSELNYIVVIDKAEIFLSHLPPAPLYIQVPEDLLSNLQRETSAQLLRAFILFFLMPFSGRAASGTTDRLLPGRGAGAINRLLPELF